MMTYAFDSNETKYYAKDFKSHAEAHSRSYFDDCGIPVTPVISDQKASHFRYLTPSGGGTGSGMSLEHSITQKRFAFCFQRFNSFHIKYWHRLPNKKLMSFEVDLKEYYNTCTLEGKIGNRYADILLSNSENPSIRPILIEVWYQHQCEPQKIKEGNFIIEFKISSLEDIRNYVKLGGLKESWLEKRQPKVRYHNFREHWTDLPWKDKLIQLHRELGFEDKNE